MAVDGWWNGSVATPLLDDRVEFQHADALFVHENDWLDGLLLRHGNAKGTGRVAHAVAPQPPNVRCLSAIRGATVKATLQNRETDTYTAALESVRAKFCRTLLQTRAKHTGQVEVNASALQHLQNPSMSTRAITKLSE